jgi:hypothetical protein
MYRKNMVYIRFGATYRLRHPLGIFAVTPGDNRALTTGPSHKITKRVKGNYLALAIYSVNGKYLLQQPSKTNSLDSHLQGLQIERISLTNNTLSMRNPSLGRTTEGNSTSTQVLTQTSGHLNDL